MRGYLFHWADDFFFSIERARSYFEAASGAHFENEVN